MYLGSCSEEIHDLILSKYGLESEIILNSIIINKSEDKKIEGIPDLDFLKDHLYKNIVFFSAFRLEPLKNPLFLLRNIPKIVKLHPRTLFLFTGVGSLELQIKSYIKKHSLEDNVVLLGRVEHSTMSYLFDLSNISIFLSNTENNGSVALLEAAVQDNLIIATDVGYTNKLIKDGENGLLVKLDDDTSLRSALSRVIENNEEREKMASNLRDYVIENYNINKVMANVYEHYEKLVEAEN